MTTSPQAAVAGAHLRLLDVDDGTDLIEFCFEQGWTDGLPVVPPTPDKVAAAIAATGRDTDEVVCRYEERGRDVTVEHIAVNAVMAGCRPEYTPVVLAIIEAISSAAYGMHPSNSTTGGAAIAFVINGPVRLKLGMNYRGNVFGPGNRANSTIGRAVRLVQINAFGSVPGAGNESPDGDGRPLLDRATVGQPGKYAGYHVVENEEDYPSLLPLHVERGFRADQSAVTAFPAGGHLQISTHHESTPQEVVDTLAHYLVNSGRFNRTSACLLVIPPESAEVFVKGRWTKANIREAVFEGTKRSVAWVKENGWSLTGGMMDRHGAPVVAGDADRYAAIADSPNEILVAIAGGPAGAFIHAVVPYGSGLASHEILLPKETA